LLQISKAVTQGMHCAAYLSTSKKREISNMICEHHFLQNTYLVLQNANHVDGVAVDANQQSKIR
jgi:hypothetical protein